MLQQCFKFGAHTSALTIKLVIALILLGQLVETVVPE